MHPKYHKTVEALKTWCQQEGTVYSAIILGSQVRKVFEGDEWSDLDILLLVDDPGEFIRTNTWLACLGDILCVTVEETPLTWLSLTWTVKRVLFSDNRMVDFSILPYNRLDDVLSINAEIHAMGYQVIYDDHSDMVASKIKTTLPTVNEASPKIPTEDELRQTIDELLFHLIWACKKIKRHELWVAVTCINQHINNLLLRLIEFHTSSVTNTLHSISYEGRFLEQRAETTIIEQLPRCFAKYDTDDAIETAGHLLILISWLSKAICEANDYSFNPSQFNAIRALYHGMFGKTLSSFQPLLL